MLLFKEMQNACCVENIQLYQFMRVNFAGDQTYNIGFARSLTF